MPVYLGLDLGEKRVGVSRSDETGTIAEAYTTLQFKSKEDLLRQIKGCIEKIQPDKIVVGLPHTLKGEVGAAAENVLRRVDWLKTKLEFDEWILWDERMTTAEAERVLLEADVSRADRKNLRDRIAAQRILQNYLDSKRND
jgi:putative Holliday junction resolvase